MGYTSFDWLVIVVVLAGLFLIPSVIAFIIWRKAVNADPGE